MLRVVGHTLREALSRRMAVALLVVSLMVTVSYVAKFSFQTTAAGAFVVDGSVIIPVRQFVQFNYPNQLNMSGWLWLMLGVFTGAPLLTSYLEKGWAELLLSKRVARWEMLLGRYLGVMALFAVSLLLVNVIPALHIWWNTGYSPGPFLVAVALILLSFASLMALMTVVAVLEPNPGLVIIAGFIQISFSRILAQRQDLYDLFTSTRVVAPVMDAIHFVIPKNTELLWAGIDLVYKGAVESWTPVWSTLLFTVVALAASCVILHRRSL